MSTLDELQRLPDGKFHLLGDDLLRRLEHRYRHLRTHGVNNRGESIKGQPDSYVGNTADTCTVAVCYTVQRDRWWKKVVEDVCEAVAASSALTEVVIVIPHNADRDGPKDTSTDWRGDAQKAAGRATIRIIDGRDLSRLLDTDHQDLRHKHLAIPYSRLCWASALAGCQTASATAINTIQTSGRYDPERYSSRSADRELYRLWQTTLRNDTGTDRRVAPVRLIALVSDSGVGKTSLVCEFARSLGRVLPVLLVQARDLTFGTEDGLVAFVVQTIQGFLDPSVRVIEETALSKHLAGPMPLTVILDGLDEAHNPDAVRRAITFWLRSRLGQSSVLVLTSRREFWKVCSDSSWVAWMPTPLPDARAPVRVADRPDVQRNDLTEGVRLPDRFTPDELEVAWIRAGQSRPELFALSSEAREELRHPFTLRVFLDLRNQGCVLPRAITRVALLEQWLNHRLDAEAVFAERISRSHFQQALRFVATKLADSNAGSISVDDLSGVPRFDSAHPPGPVVQRLIGASILESVTGHSDHIRFAVEAVQDFYRAEADVEEIRSNPAQVAERFSALTFSAAYPRLGRIGQRLVTEEVREAFVSRLTELNPQMAAIVLRAAPDRFSMALRERVTSELGREITARHRVRAALAITLLGELNCSEAARVLSDRLLPPAEPHAYIRRVGATAFIKLGHAPAAEFVYRSQRFGSSHGDDSYYFRELFVGIRETASTFRAALAKQAIEHLACATGTPEHAKAVAVLAYTGDERLVDHLVTRFTENELLAHYENHALLALGTDAAGALFARSVIAVGERLALLPNDQVHHNARNKLIWPVYFLSGDIRYLITPAFEPHLRRLIESDNHEVARIAGKVIKLGHVASLFYSMATAAAKRNSWIELDRGEERGCVTAEAWLGWWRGTTDEVVRRKLIGLLPLYPCAEVEEILLECLSVPQLVRLAALRLGEYGSVRSVPHFRNLLAEVKSQTDTDYDVSAVVEALGKLRDAFSVPLFKQMAELNSDFWVTQHAVMNLGFLGTTEAERALVEMLGSKHGEDFDDMVLEGLLACGSREAVALAIARAKTKENGPAWLCERLSRLSMTRGWTRGKYYTHIHTAELVAYLDSNVGPDSPDDKGHLLHFFEQIDSPEIRWLLRKWFGRRGTPEDPPVRNEDRFRMSDAYYQELRDRGDESGIEYALDSRSEAEDGLYVAITADHLRSFPSATVGRHLRERLAAATTASLILRMLALLGRFGDVSDAGFASRFVDDGNELVANVACETMLRLRDPLLVPDTWREM